MVARHSWLSTGRQNVDVYFDEILIEMKYFSVTCLKVVKLLTLSHTTVLLKLLVTKYDVSWAASQVSMVYELFGYRK